MKEQQAAFDKQERTKEKDELAAKHKAENEDVQRFAAKELGFNSVGALNKSNNSGEEPNKNKDMIGARQEYLEAGKEEARKRNFWVSENAHTAKATEIKEPPKHTSCPMSGKKLRLKDLIPCKLELSDKDKKEGKDMYSCAVSKKPIIYQQAFCLKPSGIVIEENTYKTVVKPTMTCPITGKKLTEKDVIKLQKGGSGFCSHSKVEVKKNMGVFGKYQDGGVRGFNIQ